MNQETVIELLLQSLEHERGGIKVYETALECVLNDDLKEEMTKYLGETRNHEQVLLKVCQALSHEYPMVFLFTTVPARKGGDQPAVAP